MNRECEFVSDLLPLYAEGIASESTCRLVEEHIAGCEECRSALDKMKQSMPIPMQTDTKELMQFKRNLTKKSILWGLSGLLLMLTLSFGAWILCYLTIPFWQWQRVPGFSVNWTIGYMFAGCLAVGLLCLVLGVILRKRKLGDILLDAGALPTCCALSCFLVTGGSFGVPELLAGPLPVFTVQLRCIGMFTLLTWCLALCLRSIARMGRERRRDYENQL